MLLLVRVRSLSKTVIHAENSGTWSGNAAGKGSAEDCRPYLGETVSALLFQHIHAPVPDLPADLARFQPLLAGLMAKERKNRFAGTAHVFRALAAFDE